MWQIKVNSHYQRSVPIYMCAQKLVLGYQKLRVA